MVERDWGAQKRGREREDLMRGHKEREETVIQTGSDRHRAVQIKTRTHTHTHTEAQRERERDRGVSLISTCIGSKRTTAF